MSAVLKLLRPGMYVKRWFLVLLVGMVVVSLGIGFALTEAYRSAVAPGWVGFITLQFLPLPNQAYNETANTGLFVGSAADYRRDDHHCGATLLLAHRFSP